MVTTDLGSGDGATAIAIQPDGKLLVAGSTGSEVYSEGGNFALVRYTPNGSLDASFGNGATVTTDFGGKIEGAAAIAVLSDGSIVVVGTTANETEQIDMKSAFALARYTPNGSLDPSFGTGGKTVTDLGVGEFGASALALQTDDKIVVVGTWGRGDFAVARYTTTGHPDPSFGKGGMVTTDFGSGDDHASSVAIQPDGKIVVVGDSCCLGDKPYLDLARYTANGSLDRGFGKGGTVTARSGPIVSGDVAVLPDGKIIVAGSTEVPFGPLGTGDFAVARYTTTGILDQSFGRAGLSTANFGGQDTGSALAVQPDGKILVVGTGADFDFALARFTPQGSLDLTFGIKGKVTTDFGNIEYGGDVAIQADGNIVMAGAATPTTTEEQDFALARYTTSGSLDQNFGSEGASPPSPSSSVSRSPGLAAGHSSPASNSSQTVVLLGALVGFALLALVSGLVLVVIRRRKASSSTG